MQANYSLAHNCVDPTHRLILCIYIVPVTFINAILLYFIRYKTIDSMKDYKMILYATTAIDFISAWAQFLIGIVSYFARCLNVILASSWMFSAQRLKTICKHSTLTEYCPD